MSDALLVPFPWFGVDFILLMLQNSHMTTQVRFWSKVLKDGPVPQHASELGACWLWIASKRNKGYGAFVYAKNNEVIQGRAHRYSWEIHYGDIPPGMCVLHKCDMPACVNPEHLWVGTKAQNKRDMLMKGRHVKGGTHTTSARYPRGEAHHGAKLTWRVVRAIRLARKNGESFGKISRRYHLSVGYVFRLIRGDTWREGPQGNGALSC